MSRPNNRPSYNKSYTYTIETAIFIPLTTNNYIMPEIKDTSIEQLFQYISTFTSIKKVHVHNQSDDTISIYNVLVPSFIFKSSISTFDINVGYINLFFENIRDILPMGDIVIIKNPIHVDTLNGYNGPINKTYRSSINPLLQTIYFIYTKNAINAITNTNTNIIKNTPLNIYEPRSIIKT